MNKNEIIEYVEHLTATPHVLKKLMGSPSQEHTIDNLALSLENLLSLLKEPPNFKLDKKEISQQKMKAEIKLLQAKDLKTAISIRDKLYDEEAGGHGSPGNRCRCNPLAGVLTNTPWGVYGLNKDKLSKDETDTIRLIEMVAHSITKQIEQGEGTVALNIINSLKELVKNSAFIEDIAPLNFGLDNLYSPEHAEAIVSIWEKQMNEPDFKHRLTGATMTDDFRTERKKHIAKIREAIA